MTSREGIVLREQEPSGFGERELDTERNESNFDEANASQWESNQKKLYVLVGSAILQLPIWGMRNTTSKLPFR